MDPISEENRNKINSKLILKDNGCWDWLGTKDKDGYSIVWINGKNIKLHRLMYYLQHGYIDDSLQVGHTCNNRYCCNPQHLEQCTHQKNIEYRNNCGRTARHLGSNNGNSKLTEDTILEILNDVNAGKYEKVSQIAEKYDISTSMIKKILLGYYWKETISNLNIDLQSLRKKIWMNK